MFEILEAIWQFIVQYWVWELVIYLVGYVCLCAYLIWDEEPVFNTMGKVIFWPFVLVGALVFASPFLLIRYLIRWIRFHDNFGVWLTKSWDFERRERRVLGDLSVYASSVKSYFESEEEYKVSDPELATRNQRLAKKKLKELWKKFHIAERIGAIGSLNREGKKWRWKDFLPTEDR